MHNFIGQIYILESCIVLKINSPDFVRVQQNNNIKTIISP